MVEFKDGAISIPGRKLAELPAGAWVRVEIAARLGEGSDAIYSLTLTPHGGAPQRFEALPFSHKDMGELHWLGFIGAGKNAAKCWLDDIEIANE